MPSDQLAFSFGVPTASKLGKADPVEAPPHLRDEIARVWGLPLGERVEITFRPAFPITSLSGRLELRSAPACYPWNAREPLALRVAGQDFTSRDIERWSLL